MSNSPNKKHGRSASFPPKTNMNNNNNNSMIQKIDEKLEKLRESEASSTSEMETLSIGLSGLAGLYKCANDALKLKQQTLHKHKQVQGNLNLPPPHDHHHPLSMKPLLDVSSKLLDICRQSKDVLITLRDAVDNVRSGLSIDDKAATIYLSERKQILSSARGVALSLKHLESQAAETLGQQFVDISLSLSSSSSEEEDESITRVVTCVSLINISVMGSLLQFLMSKPKSAGKKQGLLQRILMSSKKNINKTNGRKASVLPGRNGNKLMDVDAAVHALMCYPNDFDILGIALKRLDSMSDALSALQDHLTNILTVLTNTRASLLNISHYSLLN